MDTPKRRPRLSRSAHPALALATGEAHSIVARLETLTGTRGYSLVQLDALATEPPKFVPYRGYIGFLAGLLAGIDPDFRCFLRPGSPHTIRPEEIVWGGVAVDGIPALDNPGMIAGDVASYLNRDDEV